MTMGRIKKVITRVATGFLGLRDGYHHVKLNAIEQNTLQRNT